LYEYVGGRPRTAHDPTGNFLSLLGTFMGAAGAVESYIDYNDDVIDHGKSLRDWVMGPLNQYAFDQMLDLGWALDMGQADDLYRGSAQWSSDTGSWAAPKERPSLANRSGRILGSSVPLLREAMTKKATGAGVYLVLKENGEILYAGRSKDLATRMIASMKRVGGDRVIGIAVHSKDAIRGLEDILIRYYKEMGEAGANVINGISNTNTGRKAYYKAAQGFLGMLSKLK